MARLLLLCALLVMSGSLANAGCPYMSGEMASAETSSFDEIVETLANVRDSILNRVIPDISSSKKIISRLQDDLDALEIGTGSFKYHNEQKIVLIRILSAIGAYLKREYRRSLLLMGFGRNEAREIPDNHPHHTDNLELHTLVESVSNLIEDDARKKCNCDSEVESILGGNYFQSPVSEDGLRGTPVDFRSGYLNEDDVEFVVEDESAVKPGMEDAIQNAKEYYIKINNYVRMALRQEMPKDATERKAVDLFSQKLRESTTAEEYETLVKSALLHQDLEEEIANPTIPFMPNLPNNFRYEGRSEGEEGEKRDATDEIFDKSGKITAELLKELRKNRPNA